MTTPVVAVTPAATLGETIAVLAGKGFTSLPVVDETGRLLGVLEEDDVVLACHVPGPRSPSGGPDAGVLIGARTKIRDVMRTPGAGTHPDTELADLAERMLEHRLRSVPVLDRGRVVGVVTWGDLLRARAIETSSREIP
ncbi:CBS domain-containing protein [Amycolatopsis coloradensis]|uniref:CBS domain-containing protein n=1 Tax=Amycolatopsis coloradensis TaxID=76021 RepID=A0ACD5BEC0_9PSEU